MAGNKSSSNESCIYAGVRADGLFRKRPGEAAWEEYTDGLPAGADVGAIAIHPLDPERAFIGVQGGVYANDGSGGRWRSMNIPENEGRVCSILFPRPDPKVMYVGMTPAQIYRTADGGDSWELLPFDPGPDVITQLSTVMSVFLPSQVIDMSADPNNPDEIYAGIEVGGACRSLDGGETWQPINSGLREGGEDRLDTHGIRVSPIHAGSVYLSTREGVFHSVDKGESWKHLDVSKYTHFTHTRQLAITPGEPYSMYVTYGVSALSEKPGGLLRSQDWGETWKRVDHGIAPRGAMYAVAVDPRNSAQIFCSTNKGQFYESLDDGSTWTECSLPENVKRLSALAVG